MRRLVHPPGEILPPHLAVPVSVEEEDHVDQLVEDEVELGRLELRHLKNEPIMHLSTASASASKGADGSEQRAVSTRRVTSGPKSRYMRQRSTTNSGNRMPLRRPAAVDVAVAVHVVGLRP
jgi:hypothetical protein